MNNSAPLTIVKTGNGGFIVYEQKDIVLPPTSEVAVFKELDGRYGKCLSDFILEHFRERPFRDVLVSEPVQKPTQPPMMEEF